MIASELLATVDGIAHGFGTRDDAASHDPMPWRAKQVHSDTIYELAPTGDVPASDQVAADAIITGRRGQGIAVRTADCVPMLMVAPNISRVAAVHAGWKGTTLLIASQVVEALRQRGADVSQLKVAIGPCIQGSHYEVDEPVLQELEKTFPITSDIMQPKGEGKYWLDLAAANRHSLLEAGVDPAHIDVIDLCTFERDDLFYSYRRDGAGTGRNVSWIQLV